MNQHRRISPQRRDRHAGERAPHHDARSWPVCAYCGWLVNPERPEQHRECLPSARVQTEGDRAR